MTWPFIVLICLVGLPTLWIWAGVCARWESDGHEPSLVEIIVGWFVAIVSFEIVPLVLIWTVFRALTGLKLAQVFIGPDLSEISVPSPRQWIITRQQGKIARLEAEKRELTEQIRQREQELDIGPA